jgi:hypothetical protein
MQTVISLLPLVVVVQSAALLLWVGASGTTAAWTLTGTVAVPVLLHGVLF